MAEIKSLLDGTIKTGIRELKQLSPGSDEKTAAIQELATMHRLRIEEIKAEIEANEKRERRAMDSEQRKAELALKEHELALKERELDSKDADRAREEAFQERQILDQKIERYVRTGVDVAKLVLPIVFYGIWLKKGFKFEETGVYSSTTFKNLFNHFKPTQKS